MSIEEQFEQIRQQHQTGNGATIGDGLRASANTAAWLGGLTLLLQSAPVIIGLLCGCFLLFRGCLPSSSQPQVMQRPATQMPVYSSPGPQTSTSPVPPSQPSTHRITSPPRQQQPATRPHTNRSRTGIQPAYDPNAAQPESQPSIESNQNHRALADLLANPNSTPVMQHENNPLYSVQQGGIFEGFSQMPSQPSRRCRLTIDTIQDDGRYVSCRLSTSVGKRVTKTFEGTIEGTPSQLLLRPKTESGRIPFPNWGASWNAKQTPPHITLEFTRDGKLLFGEGTNGEVFEFVPETEPMRQSPQTDVTKSGVGSSPPENWNWKMLSRNGQTMNNHRWHFDPTSPNGGNFTWYHQDEIRAQGTYRQYREKTQLDLILEGEQEPYRGIIKPLTTQPNILQLCLSKKRGGKRPADISVTFGFVFEFRVEEQRP